MRNKFCRTGRINRRSQLYYPATTTVGGEGEMKRLCTMRIAVWTLILSLCLPAGFANAEYSARERINMTDKMNRDKIIKNDYDEEGNFYDSTGHQIRKSTIRNLLQVALQPVGKTLYIWGGGWFTPESTTIGVSKAWEKFFKKQNANYDYRNYRYQRKKGLDCSGFVGWVLYNTFNTESGHGSFVMLAQEMAYTYARWGWGEYKSPAKVKDHMAGDIMSLPAGHVYIVIGECSDGSVVLVHSSPKGVMINGTPSRKGKTKSKAWKLAKKYMKKYYKAWYKKYPDVTRGYSYLTSYSRMRWSIGEETSVLSDPEGLRNMSADKVLKVIFGEA